MGDRTFLRVIYFCFLLSGAAGLIYEVVWARRLALWLGITHHAHTAVITAFLAGLAVGALVFGRIADRRRGALFLYAWIEVGIALYGASTPWLLAALEGLYAEMALRLGIAGTASHLLRFALALVALLVPTVLMGGTLPLLVRGLVESRPRIADLIARLYGVNTLGAALGTFAAGYLLLPTWGVKRTLFFAVLLNVGVALAVFWLGRAERESPARRKKTESKGAKKNKKGRGTEAVGSPGNGRNFSSDPLTGRAARIFLVGFALSGLAALVYQVAWIRALTLVIGSSVYALSATLTIFLLGLAIGSLLYARYMAQRPGLTQAVALEVGIGWSALLTVPLLGRLPDLFLRGYAAGLHESFALFQLFTFGLSFLVIFVPTLFLGALFPLVTALWVRDAKTCGRDVGIAYAANTLGTILGALVGGLLLLPALGLHQSLVLASAIHFTVAFLFYFLRPNGSARAKRIAVTAVGAGFFALAAWALPPWDRALMSSGVFYRPERLIDRPAGRSLRDEVHQDELLYYGEGLDGTVAVVAAGDDRVMVINGKTDASNRVDLPTQVMLGQLPMLAHPAPRDILVIGLGSGITAHSVATHAEAERLAILEISSEVVEASAFFVAENGGVLEDSRVELILGDARNTLLADRRTYDVIISQPSNPWVSGISNLFTQDFFALARARLAPGGVMAQWFHVYSMSPADVKSILATYQAVFRHVTVWMPHRGDLILLGSGRPHELDFPRLKAAFDEPRLREDLERGGISGIRDLIQTCLLSGEELARFTIGATLNTDDRPRIEFNAPRNLYAETSEENLSAIVRHRAGRLLPAPISGLATPTAGGLAAPAMGLEITTATPLDDEAWQALWLVLIEERGSERFNVGAQRFLTWWEGDVETRVQASSVAAAPPLDTLPSYLSSQLGGRVDESGTIELLGGGKGLFGARSEAGELELTMVWTCAVEAEELTRYIAYRRQPDPGELPPAVLDLADRFRCL